MYLVCSGGNGASSSEYVLTSITRPTFSLSLKGIITISPGFTSKSVIYRYGDL